MHSFPFIRTALASAALLALLSACGTSQGPQPPVPDAPPTQFKETSGFNASAPALANDAWWTLFHDPVLDSLEEKLVIGNENLKLVVAQVASARAVLTGSQQATRPTLSAGLNGARSASAGSSGASSDPVNSVSLTASASWEPDLWGRLSLATQNAQSSLRASEADLAAARLSAQGTLAQSYFSLRDYELQTALLTRSVQAYAQSLALTQARYSAGVAQRTDVLQAESQLESAKSQRAEALVQRAQSEHAIAVLLGLAPSVFSIPATAALPDLPAVPAALPGSLLQRRPDIAAAQWRVKAAYAELGVADAAWFPTVSLSARAGYSQSSLASLINTPNLIWSLGLGLTQSFIDNGARTQASAQARASADQATATYRALVLTALQEVEDNLVLARHLADEVTSQDAAWQSSVKTLEIVTAQYRAGTVGYLNVTAAQSAALASEITLLSAKTRALTANSVLLKNLAGRWE